MSYTTFKYKIGFRALSSQLLMALGLLGLATACSDEDYLGGHSITDGAGTELAVKASISSVLWPDTKLTEGACYGLSVIGYDDNMAVNKEYFSRTDQDYTNMSIYIKANTQLGAYYPYTGAEKTDPYYNISTLDQDNITPLFFAKSEEVYRGFAETLNIEMHDFYGRLYLSVNAPDDDVVTSYRLFNVSQMAMVNLKDGTTNFDVEENVLKGTISNNAIQLIQLPMSLNHEDNVRMIVYGEQRNYLVVFDTLRIVSDSLTAGTITLSKDAPGTYTPDGYSQWGDSESGGEYITGSGTVTFDKDVTGQWDKSSETNVSSDSVNKDVDVDHGNNGGTDDQHLTPAGAKVAEVRDTK